MQFLPNDTITVQAYRENTGSSTLVSGTETKTILSISMSSYGGFEDQQADVKCGNTIIFSHPMMATTDASTNIHCDNPITLYTYNDFQNVNLLINYVPYDTRLITETGVTSTEPVREYDGPNFSEWLFVAGVFLFFLSFLTWSRISFTKE